MIEIVVETKSQGLKKFPELPEKGKLYEINEFAFEGGFLVITDNKLDVRAIPASEIVGVVITR